ncbi:MAG: hypothetical protein EAZ92_14825 [Candidatus Kapaibacterium sp.]|nr:MAG: hypothetical protein EAZ92_14825 [Candidatus Kapabacteria bacterium]
MPYAPDVSFWLGKNAYDVIAWKPHRYLWWSNVLVTAVLYVAKISVQRLSWNLRSDTSLTINVPKKL